MVKVENGILSCHLKISISDARLLVKSLTEIASRMIPKNLRNM